MTEQEKRLHRCCFTGHRPEKLFLVDREIIKELEREIKAAIERGYTTFISGMARGVDIWAAEIVLNLRKKNKDLHLICASPYEGFESRWSQDWQKRYKKIIKKSDYVISTEQTQISNCGQRATISPPSASQSFSG